MFLKRMETIGFKSFAERIHIEFVPGITAVVGPNGSGKSNVIDAIRWVLGEQSARSLRGQKMEDIIFQGSDTRKQLNFAEVTLILNNEAGHLPIDYQEVSVTRRVYRSGESEFYINKQACRLKDIIDLFTDTGLGRDSFSIIGQGKIDEILRSKADDRRSVFEEAAGVMKYKQRKHQAMYKLTDTEANLSRVEDIIYEINQQLTPLKKQSEKAKQYNDLMEHLKETEIALLITEIGELHKEWDVILKAIEQEKLAEIEQKTDLQRTEAALVVEREKLQQFEEKITALQQNLLIATEQLEQSEGKRHVLLEKTKHRKENKEKLQTERTGVENELLDVKKMLQDEQEHQTKIQQNLKDLTLEIGTVEEKLQNSSSALIDEIEHLKSDYIELLNKQAVYQNEQASIVRQIEQTKQLIAKQEDEHASTLEKNEEIDEREVQLNKRINLIKVNIANKEAEIEEVNQKLMDEKDNFERVQSALHQLNEQNVKLSSRKEMLIEMKENFQGYAYGVKEILRAQKMGILEKIDGAVIDLIDVPEHLMVAMDTILGAQAQYIVVPNEQIARNTINWLKKENKGRATFLPLQTISTRTIPQTVYQTFSNHSGFIGIASNLVKTDPTYKRVTEHLMGNVIVTETLEHANEIAQITNRRYRIVTLEGDIVFPGGSMSGGAQKKTGFSLFSREKEISELTKKMQVISERLAKGRAILQQHKQKGQDYKQTLIKLKEQLETLKQDFQHSIPLKKEIEMLKQSMKDQLSTYHYYIAQYEDEKKLLAENEMEQQTNLQNVQKRITEIEVEIARKTDEQKSMVNLEKTFQETLHSLQIKRAEQMERAKNSEEKILGYTERYNELMEEKASLNGQLEAIEKDEKRAPDILNLKEQIDNYRKEREQINVSLEDLRAQRQLKQQWIEDEEKELKSKQHLYNQFLKQLQTKEIESNRLDVMLDHRLNTLQSEYVITYERAVNTYEKVVDLDHSRQIVKQLKEEIEALGTVNLGSIEEFERLTERSTFLQSQKDDLLEAKQTLYDAIKEMDEEMVARFQSMFVKIQTAFTEVFKKLFGGGHAELVLTDPKNYLETGIDIVARPPGKKLKTLELLSGGERALTAIALLFAILKARPVPFVILDEVDAALDEANVERFGAYLKTFSKESQFIVISHRKGTMEAADALYGVTMQESGVSRFVSVKLEEANQLASVT